MEPEAIIFDCDGTLADTMPLHYEAWRDTLQGLGLVLCEDRFYAMGGWPTLEVARWVLKENGHDADPVRVAHDKESAFIQSLLHVTAIEPIADVARRNHGKIPLAVATGSMHAVCENVLTHLQLCQLFRVIVGCDDCPTHKPDPGIYLQAAELLGVTPARCLVYEDTDPGIESARRAGMAFVDVRTIYQPRRVSA
jgi:beta-phosphoglucomutase-like phosphatase (HAD superfamily)